MPTKTITAILAILFALISFGSFAQAQDFNQKYAAPFGNSVYDVNARVENAVRFSYFTEQGTVEGVDKPVHGGIFALQLALEDTFAFELATTWRRIEEDLAFQPSDCTDETCITETQNNASSGVDIALTPKYRFLTKDWIWASVSVTGRFPISTQYGQTKRYGVEPGFQFYFDTCDWFGVEVDLAYLLHITDPEETPYAPGFKYAPQDDETLINGAYARANFLLKIIGQHFISVHVEDTIWLHDYAAPRDPTRTREEELRLMTARVLEPMTEADKIDLAYYAKHQLNVGGGYRVNLKIFEGGIGGFVALTDTAKRQGWGVNIDTRFTF